jgi:hypothetical protein
VDNVDVGLEERLDGSSARVFSDRDTTVNARDFDPVTRFSDIHEVIIDTHGDGVGSLTVGDLIWSLLETKDLLIGELAAVVN